MRRRERGVRWERGRSGELERIGVEREVVKEKDKKIRRGVYL